MNPESERAINAVTKPATDPVNPAHYQVAPGIEVIDLTEHLDFLRGNIVKYVVRAGQKNPETTLQDLQKAAWYLDRLIAKESR